MSKGEVVIGGDEFQESHSVAKDAGTATVLPSSPRHVPF